MLSINSTCNTIIFYKKKYCYILRVLDFTLILLIKIIIININNIINMIYKKIYIIML
jgi:hypothetical protein